MSKVDQWIDAVKPVPDIMNGFVLDRNQAIVALDEQGTGRIVAQSDWLKERDVLVEDSTADCGFNPGWDKDLAVGVYLVNLNPWSHQDHEGDYDTGIDVTKVIPLWQIPKGCDDEGCPQHGTPHSHPDKTETEDSIESHVRANLRQLAKYATPGPWEVDSIRTDHGGDSFWAYEVHLDGLSIVDTLNSDRIEVEEEGDEDGVRRWDRVGQSNANYIAAVNPTTVLRLLDALDAKDAAIAKAETERNTAMATADQAFASAVATLKQSVNDEEVEALVGRLRRGLLASAGFVRDSKNPEAISSMETAINDVDAVGDILRGIIAQLRDAQARDKES